MQVVDEEVQFTQPVPSGRNRPSWFGLLKQLGQRFSSHGVAINALYDNVELGTEVPLERFTFQSLPVYQKVIDLGYGPDASGAPIAQATPHSITGMQIDPNLGIYWNQLQVSVHIFGGASVSYRDRVRILGAPGHTDEFWANSTDIVWRMNYDARLFRAIAYFQYQRA